MVNWQGTGGFRILDVAPSMFEAGLFRIGQWMARQHGQAQPPGRLAAMSTAAAYAFSDDSFHAASNSDRTHCFNHFP